MGYTHTDVDESGYFRFDFTTSTKNGTIGDVKRSIGKNNLLAHDPGCGQLTSAYRLNLMMKILEVMPASQASSGYRKSLSERNTMYRRKGEAVNHQPVTPVRRRVI